MFQHVNEVRTAFMNSLCRVLLLVLPKTILDMKLWQKVECLTLVVSTNATLDRGMHSHKLSGYHSQMQVVFQETRKTTDMASGG